MRTLVAVSLVVFLLAPVVRAANAELPTVLLFPVTLSDGAKPDLAAEATQAIKTYLRQTGKADVVDFDPESVLFKRALREHHIKPEDLVAVTTLEARLRVAGLIGADCAASGDVSVKDDRVKASVWLAQTQTKKVWRTEGVTVVSPVGARDRALSNAMQSAISSVVYQLVDHVFKGGKAGAAVLAPGPQVGSSVAQTAEPPADDAASHVDKAERFAKAGDLASAILEYRNAVNADPRNMDTRLKLVRLYEQREMHSQAIEELQRAQDIDPENEAVRQEMAAIYERRGAPDKAAKVLTSQADQRPQDLKSRLAAGDYCWKHKKFEEAEEQYRRAVEIDPNNPVPHERLALALAVQSLFNESRKELEQLAKLDPKPEPKVADERYTGLRAFADGDARNLLDQYDAGARSFANREMTRESYYDFVKGIAIRFDSISRFLEALTPPESASSTHRHRILGCSLMVQACTSTLRYLETNKASEKESAAIFAAEARRHLETAAK